MTMLTSDHALDESLGKLETSLLSPVISGELKSWLGNVRETAATFAMDLTRYLHSVLHVQYAEIVQQDSELSSHVEKMIRHDQELLDQLAKFHEDLQALEQRALAEGWDETKLAGKRKSLEHTGLDLILQIKRQCATAETWLVESLYRDRGVKD